jgi:2-methylisocitrate lyase-like PEP mutase family enzyme
MSVIQSERAARFRALHDGPGAFVIPNPWDVGSARILAGLGFQALATSSSASANALGRRDGGLTLDEALAHARSIVDATDLPVSADLEKGFGDAPEVVAETIRLAAGVGLVGCTIEDATGNPDSPLYDTGLAVERIAAAAQAARALPFPFVLTARVHNLLYAAPSLNDTISRLQSFEEAGADVLFAPGLPDLAAVRAVCAAVSKPVNFMVGIKGNPGRRDHHQRLHPFPSCRVRTAARPGRAERPYHQPPFRPPLRNRSNELPSFLIISRWRTPHAAT